MSKPETLLTDEEGHRAVNSAKSGTSREIFRAVEQAVLAKLAEKAEEADRNDIHSCSLHCDRPECVKAQRDEMRDRLAEKVEPVAGVVIDGDMNTPALVKRGTAREHVSKWGGSLLYTRPPTDTALLEAAEKALVDLSSASSFYSIKSRNRAARTIEALRAAIEAHKGKA